MMFNHWRNYEPVTGITTFGADNSGPAFADLQVIANTHESDAYPDSRIALVVAGLRSVGLTAEQSASLRASLHFVVVEPQRAGAEERQHAS